MRIARGSQRAISSSPCGQASRRQPSEASRGGFASFPALLHGAGVTLRASRSAETARVADQLLHEHARFGPVLAFLLEVDDRIGPPAFLIERPAVLRVTAWWNALTLPLRVGDHCRQPRDEQCPLLRALVVVVQRHVVPAPLVHGGRGAAD